MFIRHVTIKNFRTLEDISFDLSPQINVVVGPNGVGKTTILQAIRLAKGLAAPRVQQEAQNILISLSAASPHFPQRIFMQNLAGDYTKSVEIRCTFSLTDMEIGLFEGAKTEFIQNIVAARLGQNFANPATLIQFLQSPMGRAQIDAATIEVDQALAKLKSDKTVIVGVTIDALRNQILPADPLGGSIIAFLDQRLPPTSSIFSYFPADRALPMGEVNMQLGGPDAQQQLESHNSQPQIKYQRLKTLIVNSIILQEPGQRTVKEDFQQIFSGLLKERIITEIKTNELGLLSIMTENNDGKPIELDSLSSGEKNIALTFLLVARSIAEGGVALFDEPELHLNPAVSRDLLSFVMNTYSKPRHMQFLMCTHSPEILSGAFKDDDCVLLHLKGSKDITKVGKQSLGECADALQRLGTTISETLIFDGTVFVEGDQDVDFLTDGYPDLFRKLQIKKKGGRPELEKGALELQELEKRGEQTPPVFVILDNDGIPTSLRSTNNVRILQWPRRCAENYLIDSDVLANILKDDTYTRTPITSAGEVHKKLSDLAFAQLDEVAARETFGGYTYLGPSYKREDVKNKLLPEIAQTLCRRVFDSKQSLPVETEQDWIAKFTADATQRKEQLKLIWEAKWQELCDGKRLIADFHRNSDMKMSEKAFREKIVRTMRDKDSELWRSARSLLEDLLKKKT